jgi:putative acetyltransferase
MAAEVVLVAEDDDGRLAGFAQLEPGEGVVHACYVDPDLAGRGAGRALMAAIEDDARARGCTMLALDASLNAVSFYETLGWRRESETRHDLGHGACLDCVVMSKRIA